MAKEKVSKEVTKAASKVMGCSCKHSFQDGKYGVGMRYHTHKRSTKIAGGEWMCSVCGKVR